MITSRDHIAIIGASLAGLRSAEALRREGFRGRVTLVGDEPHLPYNRPPLSKKVLSGELDEGRVALTSQEKLDALDIELALGAGASSLDTERRVLGLADGRELHWDGLVIATGARARRLPGTDGMEGVLALRTLDDARALRGHLGQTDGRIVICGAGFVGAEVAASARSLGRDVTVVEMAETPLARVLGEEMGQVCAQLQLSSGVDLITGVGVTSVDGGDHVTGVTLTDGRHIPADIVVMGIGAVPNTEWLGGSDLTVDDGVVCDETCLAAPGVVAAGDVARWPNPLFDGESMRVEHWENASLQAAHAVRTLLAGESGGQPYAPVPWFWSDQFGTTIQLAGRPRPTDEMRVVSGVIEKGTFAAAYGRAGRLVGILGFNAPREVAQYRGLIAQRASWDEAPLVAA